MDISKLNLEQIKKIIKKAQKIDVVDSQKINDVISKLNFDIEIANSDLDLILNPQPKVKKEPSMTAKEFQTMLEKNNEIVYKKMEKNNEVVYEKMNSMISTALEKNNKVVLSQTKSMIEKNNEIIYAKMDEKFAKIDERFNKIDHRLDGIEGRLTNLEKDMVEVKTRLKNIEDTPTMKKELHL